MNGWATFWGAVLAIALVVFAGLAVVVSIGGLRDIRTMIRKLESGDGTGAAGDGESQHG